MKVLNKIEKFLPDVEKPARYTGGELNMVKKNLDDVDIRFAFCFPDVYEVGMSFLGLSILYHLLNERTDTYVERVFSPWPDMEDAMKANDVPLFSLETHSTLDEFDVFGFNISYEMCYSNIVRAFDMAGIPALSASRSEEDPLVIAGGSAIFNPEPIADFMDAVFIGESEETLNALLDLLKKSKQAGWTKKAFLEAACSIESVYVPSFYAPEETDSGYQLKPINSNAKPIVSKSIIRDLDASYFSEKPIVPYLGIVHDRITLEIFRGCTRGCRFCQAGFTNRPIREKKADTLTKQAVNIESATGYDEVSLCSLSTSDYSEIGPLIGGLLDELADKRVNISLPSLRLDTVFKDYAKRLDSIRKSGLTFAPEAGTQRLRDIINKNVTEEDLFSTMEQVFSQGYTSVKLYFMIGLPFETYKDLDGIVELVKGVKSVYGLAGKNNKRGLTLTVSASNFVPKPFTPFQWVPQDSIETLKEKQ
ncbi:MAG: TIGR03960 family B12-binding radical SAM protein, partial [Eubacteriales bacterium]